MSTTAVNSTYNEDFEDDFVLESPVQARKARRVSAILLACVLAVAAFWGGAVVQKHWGTSTTAGDGAFAGGGAQRTGGAPTGAGAGGTGAAGAATPAVGATAATPSTTGKVVSVSGNTVTITDSTGKTAPSSSTALQRYPRQARPHLATSWPVHR